MHRTIFRISKIFIASLLSYFKNVYGQSRLDSLHCCLQMAKLWSKASQVWKMSGQNTSATCSSSRMTTDPAALSSILQLSAWLTTHYDRNQESYFANKFKQSIRKRWHFCWDIQSSLEVVQSPQGGNDDAAWFLWYFDCLSRQDKREIKQTVETTAVLHAFPLLERSWHVNLNQLITLSEQNFTEASEIWSLP